MIQLPGQAVVPGFIDTHAHLTSLGGGLTDLDLGEIDSARALLSLVASESQARPPDAWITGTGWVDSEWDPGTMPNASALDRASGGRPVVLFRHDRHALLASTGVLSLAGITDTTPDPPGGHIARDPIEGGLSGLLVDSAMEPVTAILPPPSPEALAQEAEQKGRLLSCLGVTSVHEAFVQPPLWRALHRLVKEGRAVLRVRAILGEDWSSKPDDEISDRLTAIGFKAFADGALGSCGAQLTEPYEDTGRLGLPVESDGEIAERAELARALGLQLAVHAIGDAGVRRVLNLFDRAWGASRGFVKRRWRIEHAQIIHPDDMGRLQGVCLATQPIHLLADGPWAPKRLGWARLRWGYRLRTLIDAGAVVGFGSDFPIEDGDPLAALAVLEHPNHPLVPAWDRRAERISRYQLFEGYWRRAAYLAFDEHRLGRLLPGYHADFVCLDGDPFEVESLLQLKVVATYVGGHLVYESQRDTPQQREL